MTEFTVGDRVRVKAECATYFTQPWRKRFDEGREGTIISIDTNNRWANIRVLFDTKRGKRYDWTLSMYARDIEKVQE